MFRRGLAASEVACGVRCTLGYVQTVPRLIAAHGGVVPRFTTTPDAQAVLLLPAREEFGSVTHVCASFAASYLARASVRLGAPSRE